MDALIVEFRPNVFLEEVRRVKRDVQLELEGFKLSVIKPIEPDQQPVTPFAEQFIAFLREQ